mmetsp:Transcript_7705/g.13947  ORF Transcript_7705/g.13947 Transcript_7705/m.13947 type:complete len:211 (+) Transcript_7705:192-824(+)
MPPERNSESKSSTSTEEVAESGEAVRETPTILFLFLMEPVFGLASTNSSSLLSSFSWYFPRPLRSLVFSERRLLFSCSRIIIFSSSSEGRKGPGSERPIGFVLIGEMASLLIPLRSSEAFAWSSSRVSLSFVISSPFSLICSSFSSAFLASLLRAMMISFSRFSHCLLRSRLSSKNSLPRSSLARISSTSLFIVPSNLIPSRLMMVSASL